MPEGPVLETRRLILRRPVQEDLPAWAAFMADEQAARHIGGVQLRDVAWRGMAMMAGSWVLQGYGMFSVIEKESGRWIGRLGPWRPAGVEGGWPGTEIAWGLAREAWGKGYAREGAIAAMNWAVDHLGWTDLIHTIAPTNTASQNLAMHLGSANRGAGKLPPPFQDSPVDIWGQTAAQWRERRKEFDA